MMYEIATFRRPSQMPNDEENPPPHPPPADSQSNAASNMTGDDTPTTPNMSVFEIDDEFNLPISLALFILIAYIFIGAVVYCVWEQWAFFDAFYFVFISMSTIGFGDYVPKNPYCMIMSIVYLVFGLALMSMCINVVQEKLSNTFKQASAKLGASMGLEMSESGSLGTAATVEIVETVPVHRTGSETNVLDIPSQQSLQPLKSALSGAATPTQEENASSKKSDNILSVASDENISDTKNK